MWKIKLYDVKVKPLASLQQALGINYKPWVARNLSMCKTENNK